jgi:hypothetical protein
MLLFFFRGIKIYDTGVAIRYWYVSHIWYRPY